MDKNNNIAMVHIVAAIMVIIGHQFVLLGLTPPALFGVEVHRLGVCVLFLISGWLVTGSYLRARNAWEYLKKRITRLYPPLLLCLIATSVVMRTVTDSPEYYLESAGRYIINNLEMRPKFDLAGVFENNPYPVGVNGSLWTLPIELACYIVLIPSIKVFQMFSRINRRQGIFIFASLLPISLSAIDLYATTCLGGEMVVLWDTNWLNGVSLGVWFFFGVSFQLLGLRKICNLQLGVLVIVTFACCPPSLKYIILPYAVGYLTMCFALAAEPLFQKTIKRDICYGMYLYAFPIQQLLIQVLVVRRQIYVSPYLLIIITVGLVSVIATIQTILVEEKKFSRVLKMRNGKGEAGGV